MQTPAIRNADIAAPKIRTTTSLIIPSPFKWLRDLNAALIAYFQFKNLSEERLRDAGISKRQHHAARFGQFWPRDGR